MRVPVSVPQIDPLQDATRQQDFSSRWLGLDLTVRAKVKEQALSALASPNSRVGQVAAQFVAAIAAVELPVGQWGDLIEVLLGFMNTQGNTPLRVATLQAIGYI